MYATKLAESDALQTWNQDFHGTFFIPLALSKFFYEKHL